MEPRPSLTARRAFIRIAVIIAAGLLTNASHAQQQPALIHAAEAHGAKAHGAGDKAEDVSQYPQPDRRSLKEAVGDRFKIGVGVSHRCRAERGRCRSDPAAFSDSHARKLHEATEHPSGRRPAGTSSPPTASSTLLAPTNSKSLVTALFGQRTIGLIEWMMKEHGEPVSRETLLRRIETHINTVVQRYADAVTMWDVVNEAIGDGERGPAARFRLLPHDRYRLHCHRIQGRACQGPGCPVDLQRLQRPQAREA